MLIRLVPNVSALLTPEQRRRLPAAVVRTLDPRYLLSIRSGSHTFVGPAGGGLNFGDFFDFGR